MDRSQDSPNPGMVERQMDETPMEGGGMERENLTRGGTSAEREGLQGSGGTEREGLQGGGGMERENLSGGGEVEREGMQGGEVERDSMTAGDRASGSQDERTGGYGYDRPAEMGAGRDMDAAGGMEGMERSGGAGSLGGAGRGIDRENPDRMDGTTGREGMARDW